MDIRRLSDADKYMLYGLLLRKRRPADAELRVLEIMRAQLSLDQKIDAILTLHRQLPGFSAEEEEQTAELLRPGYPGRRKRRLRAVVADPYPEVTRLLAKSSLRWDLEFVQAEDLKQALYLVRKLRARLLVCNLPMPPGERDGLARKCRERQSRINLIFLAAPSPGEKSPEAMPSRPYRVLPKPINLNQLSEAVREMLEE